MPRVCSICGVSYRRGRGSGVFLHELPAEIVRRKQWVDAVYKLTGEHRMLQWESVNYTICSRHFNKSDYKPDYKIRILEKGVIPTILGPPPEPRTRNPVAREPTNGRISDKDLELSLLRAASSVSKPENENGGEKTAAPRKDIVDGAPRKKKAEKKTSVPRRRKKKADKTEDAKTVSKRGIGVFQDPVDAAACDDAETSDGADEAAGAAEARKRPEATTLEQRLEATRRQANNLRRQLVRRNARVRRLRQRLLDASRARRASETPWRAEKKAFGAVLREAQQGDLRAQFLLEQVCNFGKRKSRWSEPFIRECVLLCSVSAPTYDLVRTSPLLKGAPSRTTLKRFIGCGVKDEEVDQDGDEEGITLKMEDELEDTNEVEEELSDFSGEENALGDTTDDQE